MFMGIVKESNGEDIAAGGAVRLVVSRSTGTPSLCRHWCGERSA